MNLRLLFASTLLGVSLAACNGGGNAPAPIGPVSTGPVTTTISSTALTAGQPITTGSALQAASGISSFTPTLPSGLASSASNASYSVSNVAPSGVPTLKVAGPVAQSVQSSSTVANATDILFLNVTPTSTISLSGDYSVSFTFANGVTSGTSYYLAVYNGSTWTANATGTAGSISGSTVTFSSTFPANLSLSANTPYVIALYSIATPTLSTSGSVPLQISGTPVSVSGSLYNGTESLTLPNASVATTLGYSLSTTAPSGVTPPTSGVTTVLGYATVSPTASTSFASGSQATLTYTPTSGSTSGTYNLAYSLDGQTWVTGVAASTTSSGTTSTGTTTFNLTASSAVNLTGGSTYYLALYQ